MLELAFFFFFFLSLSTPSELGPLNHKFHFLSVRSFCKKEKKLLKKKDKASQNQPCSPSSLSLSFFLK